MSHAYDQLTVFGFYASFLSLLPMVFVAWILALAFHEAGHFFAAILVGFRIQSVHVGPLFVFRTYQGFDLGPAARFLSWVDGGVIAIPRGQKRYLRAKLAIFSIAGPLASLGAAIASFYVSSVVASDANVRRLVLFGAVNLALAVANAIPMEIARGHPSDAAELLAFFDEHSLHWFTWKSALAYSQAIGGTVDYEFRAVDELLSEARRHEPDPGRFTTGPLALALDAGRFDLAKPILAAALEARSAALGSVSIFVRDAAILSAFEEGKPDALRLVLHLSRAAVRSRHELDVLEAALHVVEGSDDLARSSLKEWPEFLGTVADRGKLEFDMRWIVRLVEARLGSRPPVPEAAQLPGG